MTVKDFIAQMPERDEYVFLGASSGFYLIVKPDFLLENEEEFMEDIRKEAGRIRADIVEYSERRIATYKSNMQSNLVRIRFTTGSKLESFERAYKNKLKCIDGLMELESFSGLEVTDVHRRFDGTGYNLLTKISSLKPTGTFWALDEWKRVHGDGINVETLVKQLVGGVTYGENSDRIRPDREGRKATSRKRKKVLQNR